MAGLRIGTGGNCKEMYNSVFIRLLTSSSQSEFMFTDQTSSNPCSSSLGRLFLRLAIERSWTLAGPKHAYSKASISFSRISSAIATSSLLCLQYDSIASHASSRKLETHRYVDNTLISVFSLRRKGYFASERAGPSLQVNLISQCEKCFIVVIRPWCTCLH
jgi:hypothetical protein